MGVVLSLLAAVFSASKDLISKHLALTLHGTLSAFASFLFALPYYLLILLVLWLLGLEEFAVSREFLALVLLRSVTDAAAESLKMHSLSHGDISLLSPFLSLSPAFLLLTSPLITGDRFSAVGAGGVLLVVFGAIVVLYRRSGYISSEVSTKGLLLAIASSFCFSLNACFDRLAVQIASPTLSGFAMTAAAALMLAPLALRRPGWAGGLKVNFKSLSARGALEVVFMITKLAALQYLQAPYVSALMKSSVLLSVIGGRVLFREEDFLRRILASALIIVGSAIIVLEGL